MNGSLVTLTDGSEHVVAGKGPKAVANSLFHHGRLISITVYRWLPIVDEPKQEAFTAVEIAINPAHVVKIEPWSGP